MHKPIGHGNKQLCRHLIPLPINTSSILIPEIGDDIPTWLRRYNYDFYDPRAYAPLFWPEGRPKKGLDILVAGCGTMQGAVIAFLNPECLASQHRA